MDAVIRCRYLCVTNRGLAPRFFEKVGAKVFGQTLFNGGCVVA